MISPYSKIYNVGHKEVKDILDVNPIWVQEKIDGSQFSFGVKSSEVFVKSKNAVIDLNGEEDVQILFRPAVNWVIQHQGWLKDGYTYRAEAVCRPKHNTLEYERAPEAGFILYDVDQGDQDYLEPPAMFEEAARLNVEAVQSDAYLPGSFNDIAAQFHLTRNSMLGGMAEGFVIKDYSRYSFGKTLMAKHVNEVFKEVHQGDWKKRNPGRKDVIAQIINDFGGPARWYKAVQTLRDLDALDSAPNDIGALMKLVQVDLRDEQESAIKDTLFIHFWKEIKGGVSKGLPDWYKKGLLTAQLEGIDVDQALEEMEVETTQQSD